VLVEIWPAKKTELGRKFKGKFVWWNIWELVILMSIKNLIWLPEQIMPFNLLSLKALSFGNYSIV
jgi:hypothetical protein